MKCTVRGCHREQDTRLLCHTHYEKLRRSGTLKYKPRLGKCRACDRKAVAKNVCNRHYMKLRRTGTLQRFRMPAGSPMKRADIHRKNRYGVTPEDYRESLKLQDGACAICKRPLDTTINTHQDHDHSTMKARGVLCRDCNMAIGCLERTGIPGVWLDLYLDDWTLYNEPALREEATRRGIA